MLHDKVQESAVLPWLPIWQPNDSVMAGVEFFGPNHLHNPICLLLVTFPLFYTPELVLPSDLS